MLVLLSVVLGLLFTLLPANAWPRYGRAPFVEFASNGTISSVQISSDTTGSASSANSATSVNSTTPTSSSSSASAITSVTASDSTSTASSSSSSEATSAPTSNPFSIIPANYTSPQIPYPLIANQTSANTVSSKWYKAHKKAKAHLKDWTVEEKVQLTTGVGWEIGRCVGNTPDIPSKNWTGLCLEDSPLGVRFADFVSAFPAGINTASTFDKDLMYARGYAMGSEHKGKGVNIALGPMTNMGRVAAGGRNWEGFGGDPYLSGWATEMTIRGMQDAGVQACVKHFIGNEQERNRTTSSSNLDDRTMREIYTHPFLKAVMADVASVMCSYNLVNGSWACQNSKTLNGILKTDFGFQGFVMSDWQATESGVLAVNSGLDMTMPGDITFNSGTSYFGTNLTNAVGNGSVALERLDDMAQRIVAAWYLVDQDKPYPAVNFDAFRRTSDVNNSHVDVQGDHYQLIRKIGAASTVLLKNNNNTLPLFKPRTLALIGSDMGPSMQGPNGYSDHGGDDGTLAMGWGSGTADFPYLIDPLQALTAKAQRDHTTISWWLKDFDLDGAKSTASYQEVVIVGINSDSGEDYITVDGNEGDRNNLTAWHGGDDLILAVASVNKNVIVVVHSVGPLIIEPWIDHPNITAVLWAGLPGQESGNSLVEILYGHYNPSGRLPYTIAKNRSDYSADIKYVNTSIPNEPQVDYVEGLNIDYRHFLANNITPRYEFGYGLSYTEFEFTDLEIQKINTEFQRDTTPDLIGTVGEFTRAELQTPQWSVSAKIKNIGKIDGCEIPQLYLKYPNNTGEPPKVLRDFARINLEPNQTSKVYFNLSNYDLSVWNVVSQSWVIPSGEFGVVVGKSCLDPGSLVGTFCPYQC